MEYIVVLSTYDASQLSLYIAPTLMYIAGCIQLYSIDSDLRFIFVCSFHGIE